MVTQHVALSRDVASGQPWIEEFWSNGPQISVAPLTFTAAENPYLFPLGLLNAKLGRAVPEGEECDRRTESGREAGDAEATRWWLIHSKPRQEKRLAAELRARNVPHYLPVTLCKATSRGRTRTTRAPQFPGYLFLNGTSEQRIAALRTNRVVATHVVEDQLRLVKQLWDLADLIEKGVPLRIEEKLVAGQCVRVKSGLLKDKCGVIMKRGGKTRLFVLVNELLGGVSLEIEQHLLEPY